MVAPARRAIIDYMTNSRDAITAAIEDAVFVETVAAIADRISDALTSGHKVMLAGNGGSAADAQHIAGELVGRFQHDRAPAAALALTADSAVLTAIANDYGYRPLFERQVRGLGRRGDVLIGISTSGRSENILRALSAARETGITAIGFTRRQGDEMERCCDICLHAPAASTPVIQQLHLMAGHIICQLVEARLFPQLGDNT